MMTRDDDTRLGETSAVRAHGGPLSHIGEPRVDKSYWDMSWGMRTYMRLMYSTCGGLCMGWLASSLGLPGNAQWFVALGTFAIVISYRWFRPNGGGNLLEEIISADDQARQELLDGDYSGVPDRIKPMYAKEQTTKATARDDGRKAHGRRTGSSRR